MSDKKTNVGNFRWIRNPQQKGERLFTFDGKRIFSLFEDYPYNLSYEERKVFDEINPFWAEFFKDRVN